MLIFFFSTNMILFCTVQRRRGLDLVRWEFIIPVVFFLNESDPMDERVLGCKLNDATISKSISHDTVSCINVTYAHVKSPGDYIRLTENQLFYIWTEIN